MMKFFLKILPCIFLIILFSRISPGNETAGFLHVKGDKVLDASGRIFILRGFNVEFKDFKGILGERDIRKIAWTGANSIRVSIDSRDFEDENSRFKNESFSLLDSVLKWCETYGIYVIIDMHLVPGRQNPHDFVVHRENTYYFWSDKRYQERFYALWSEIARRYSNIKIIAGYDMLNEGVPPSLDEYSRIINAAAVKIRLIDKNHMLIVQEAILFDGTKKLVRIKDDNVLYSIHFFYPPQFSFYVTTDDRAIIKYPGEISVQGEKIGESKLPIVDKGSGWNMVSIRTVPPEGAEIFLVNISSSGNKGILWLDDVALEIDGKTVDLPAPLVKNSSFETDYPGINWKTDGNCISIAQNISRTGARSLKFSGCKSASTAVSSSVEVIKGRYLLSAWYKAENAGGSNYISISWHRKKVLSVLDKKTVLDRFNYALQFKSRHNVPIYVGEFTGHANPENISLENYLNDLLDFMNSNGFHWSFWEYYSAYEGVGLFTGNPPRLANPEAFSVLKTYLRKRTKNKPHIP